jgi:hypothetical protein
VRRVPLDGGAASPTVAMMFQQWFGILSDGSYEWIRTDSIRARVVSHPTRRQPKR